MARELHVAREVAQRVSSHNLSQAEFLARSMESIPCAVCRQPILTDDETELVVFRDQAYQSTEFAHPDCLISGVYEKPGLDDHAQERLKTRPQLGTNSALMVMPEMKNTRLVCAVEVIRMWTPDRTDAVEVWAKSLGLPPYVQTNRPKIVVTTKLRVGDRALEIVQGNNVIPLNNDREAAQEWISQSDNGFAWLIVGRGLGVDKYKTNSDFLNSLDEAVCWGAPVRVQRPGQGLSRLWKR